MKTQKNPVTLLIIFGLWLGLILGCSKAMEQKRIEREGTGITISAEDLYKAYESNEAEADKLYQGKMLIVTGTVGDASTPDVIGNPYVGLTDARKSPIVQCLGFAVDQKDAVSKLKTGQTVTVKGKGMGRMMGKLIVLEDSALQ